MKYMNITNIYNSNHIPKSNLNTLKRAFLVLPLKARKRVVTLTAAQIAIGGLDLLGIFSLGILGTISVNGVRNNDSGTFSATVLKILYLNKLDFQMQALVLGMMSIVFLVGRTCLSVLFTRQTLFFLSRSGAVISSTLISKILSQSFTSLQSNSSQQKLFSVTRGVELVAVQVLATAIATISDFSLLIIICVTLFVINPPTAIISFLVFSLVGYLLYKFMYVHARSLGEQSTSLSIESNEKILEVFATYRESLVRNRRFYYANEIGKTRMKLADKTAELNFLPYVSKYMIESMVIVTSLILGGVQFALNDTATAVSTIAIFVAAGSRLAPAVLRIQQGLLLIQSSIGQAAETLSLIEDLAGIDEEDLPLISNLELNHSGFIPEIKMEDLTFTYPGSQGPTISSVTLDIPPGSLVAIVGPSGSGKTTLVDLIIGALQQDKGNVLISGSTPSEVIQKWPGAISYVPQDVIIINGNIRENIALGYQASDVPDALVIDASKKAQLQDLIELSKEGLEAHVGEGGSKISGGQRQRLGIARALLTNPKLLVLDEATSSLDGETENRLTSSLSLLHGNVTVIMIAHRLSTVRFADIVVYVEGGKVRAIGTFEEVRDSVPNFDLNAKLMGF